MTLTNFHVPLFPVVRRLVHLFMALHRQKTNLFTGPSVNFGFLPAFIVHTNSTYSPTTLFGRVNTVNTVFHRKKYCIFRVVHGADRHWTICRSGYKNLFLASLTILESPKFALPKLENLADALKQFQFMRFASLKTFSQKGQNGLVKGF
jgi:hypothetical protein